MASGRYANLMVLIFGLSAVVAVCSAASRFDESAAEENVDLVERAVDKQGMAKSKLETVSRGATHYAYCNCTGTGNCCTCDGDEITGTKSGRLSPGATHRFIFTCQNDTYFIGYDREVSKSSIVSCTVSEYGRCGNKSVASFQCTNWKIGAKRFVTYTEMKCCKS